jgi:uncharacterized protein (TIGR03435 family)
VGRRSVFIKLFAIVSAWSSYQVSAASVFTSAPQQVFEAASIKTNQTIGSRVIGGRCRGIDSPPPGGNPANNVPLGRCVFRFVTLKELVGLVYDDRRAVRITGGPNWLGTARFDVEAKAENPTQTTEASLQEMLRNLLLDRFKLKLHLEDREMRGVALVISKNGPKLARAQYAPRKGSFIRENGTLVGRGVAMAELAEELSYWLRRPIIDATTLQGRFDVRLRYTPQDGELIPPPPPPPPGPPSRTTDEPEPPSVFDAIQEQLGLRLEARNVRLQLIVVDSAEQPQPNRQ